MKETHMKMNAYQRYLIEEFVDEYHERQMTRRDLIRRAVLIMGSVPAAASALIMLGCGSGDDDDAATPAPTNAATQPPASSPATAAPTAAATAVSATAAASPAGGANAQEIRFKGPASDLLGYIARPEKAGTYPGVVIIHENRGLLDHFRDVARRYAAEGFVALAVDLVSRAGGTKADTAANTGALGSAKPEDLVADMVAYVNYLKTAEGVKAGGVGVTGFCFGGGYTFEAAIASADVKAAVPYYGICRLIDDLPKTQAAVLVMYAANDNRVTSQAEQVKAQLAKSGKPFEVKVWPGANHAFFNDTGANYNAEAAKGAWADTLAWFRKYLPA
jgi:carboxymethylenebutenolidase